MMWSLVVLLVWLITVRTSLTTVRIVSAKRNLEHTLVPFTGSQVLYCDVFWLLMRSLIFPPLTSSRHHQSGTAAPNTMATIVKHTIHFMECTMKDNAIWNRPHPPTFSIRSSKLASGSGGIVVSIWTSTLKSNKEWNSKPDNRTIC